MSELVAIPLGLFMLSVGFLIRGGLSEIADAIRDINEAPGEESELSSEENNGGETKS